MDILLLVFSGAFVGFAIGLTGVGGGSLMTPILLLFNYPVTVAIGTDLLYAAIAKSSGIFFHHQEKHINWKVMGLMAAGSLPASLLVHVLVIDASLKENGEFEAFLTGFLGFMLILTSLVILFGKPIQRRIAEANGRRNGTSTPHPATSQKHTAAMTVLLGVVLGICVTLSSVGAGAFAAAILFLLYPAWPTVKVVGTDIAHAVPLTLVAGLGYLFNGQVDFSLLLALVVGALPGIYLGTKLSTKLPEKLLRGILVTALLIFGLNFIRPLF